MKFVDLDFKKSKASKSTPQKAPISSKPRTTHATAKEDPSDVITDATPIFVVSGRVPKKTRTKSSTMKKGKPLIVSKPSSPYVSVHMPENVKNVKPKIVVKKPNSMASLYSDPIENSNVDPNAITFDKIYVVPDVVGHINTHEKLASTVVTPVIPRSDLTIGQYSLKESIIEIDHMSPTKIVGSDLVSSPTKRNNPNPT